MALDLGTITVTLEAAVSDFQAQLSQVSSSLTDLSAKVQPVALAAGAAFASIGAGLGFLVRASSAQTEASMRLASAIKASGQAIDVAKIDELAVSLQGMTTFEDDATIATSALFTRLGLVEDQIVALLPATADLAAAMGTDLPSAALTLGRAIATGSTDLLRRQGVVFDEVTQKAFANADANQRTAIILEKLRSTVGGMAQAMTQTAGGALAQMTNSLGDVAEAAGAIFEPIAVGAFQRVRDAANGFASALANLSPAAKGVVATAVGIALAVTGITAAVTGLIALWPQLMALKAMFVLAVPPILAATAAVLGLVAAGIAVADAFNRGLFSDAFEGFAEGAKAYGSAALDTIRGLGADIVAWLSQSFAEAFDVATGTARAFADAILAILPSSFVTALTNMSGNLAAFASHGSGLITRAFGQAFGWVQDLVAGVADTITGFFGHIGTAIYSAIVGAVKKVVGVLSSIFGTAFDYWRDKFSSIGEGLSIGGAGGAAGAAPPIAQAAQARFGPLLQTQLVALAKSAKDSADELTKMRDRMAAWSDAAQEGARVGMAAQIAASEGFAQGASAALYNAASSAFGPESILANAAGALGEALDQTGGAIAGSLVGKMGKTGSLISAGLEGFSSGGPFGAIIAVVAQLVMFAPAFGRMVGALNAALEPIIGLLDSVLQGIEPLIDAIGMVLQIVGRALAPIFNSLGAILYALLRPIGALVSAIEPFLPILLPGLQLLAWGIEKLSQVVAAVAYGILFVVKGIAGVWNGIVGAVERLFRKIADIEVFGKRPFGFMDKWANSIERAKIATDGMQASMDDLSKVMRTGAIPASEQVGDSMAGAAESVCAGSGSDTSVCEATGGLSDAVSDATESLLNVPSGYKMAAARFDAAMGASASLQAAMGLSPLGARAAEMSGGKQVTIEQVTIVSDNPEEVWRGIQRVIEWDNYANSGSSVTPSSPYAVSAV